MSEFIRKNMTDGVAFSSFYDNRFKTGRIGASLIVPLDKKNAAANSLLAGVLTRSCKKYPDYTLMGKKLNSLYSASVFSRVSKIGNNQILDIIVSGIDDQYALYGEKLSEEYADLICSAIFEPNVQQQLFSVEDIEQERREILEEFDSEFNEKRIYATRKCIELMLGVEPYMVNGRGNREEIETVRNEQVYAAWENILKKARVELTMLGTAEPERVFDKFSSYFEKSPRTIEKIPVEPLKTTEVRRFAETGELSQSKLVMGLECAAPETVRGRIANDLMSAVLGGTATSKFFINVREKQSLCYYCSSVVNNYKGFLLVSSGVETANIEKTEKAILEQIEELKNGVLSDEELSSAKLSYKNSVLSSYDSLSSIQSQYISKILTDMDLPASEILQIVDSITKEELIDLAGTLKLNTVFSLIGN